jgi:hypothetical protein
MSGKRQGSGQRLAALIVGGVGTVLAVAGGLTGFLFPRSLDAERLRLEKVRPLTLLDLASTLPGELAVIEGRIAPGQPRIHGDFVACVVRERRRSKKNENSWNTKEHETPPLILDVSGGLARVVNTTYEMKGSLTSLSDSQVDSFTERYASGLVAGEQVFVVGRAAPGGLDAAFVTPGTYESYLSGLEASRKASLWLGGSLVGVGGMLLSVGAALLLFRGRNPSKPARAHHLGGAEE